MDTWESASSAARGRAGAAVVACVPGCQLEVAAAFGAAEPDRELYPRRCRLSFASRAATGSVPAMVLLEPLPIAGTLGAYNGVVRTGTVDLLVLRGLSTPPGLGGSRSFLTGTAARLVGCHPATVRRAIERGDLEAFRLGPRGAHRITLDALQQWARSSHDPQETP